LASKFFCLLFFSVIFALPIAISLNRKKWRVINKFWLWLNNHYYNKIYEYNFLLKNTAMWVVLMSFSSYSSTKPRFSGNTGLNSRSEIM